MMYSTRKYILEGSERGTHFSSNNIWCPIWNLSQAESIDADSVNVYLEMMKD